MRFSLSGHDLIRLVSAAERVDAMAEGFARVSGDDQSVIAKGRNVTQTGIRVAQHGAGEVGYRRVIRV